MKQWTWLPASLALLLASGCSYSPKADDVVEKRGEYKNIAVLEKFIEQVQSGQTGSVRVVRYTTEGDPILQDISFDGKALQYKRDASHDTYGGGVEKDTCKSIVKNAGAYMLTGCSKAPVERELIPLPK